MTASERRELLERYEELHADMMLTFSEYTEMLRLEKILYPEREVDSK